MDISLYTESVKALCIMVEEAYTPRRGSVEKLINALMKPMLHLSSSEAETALDDMLKLDQALRTIKGWRACYNDLVLVQGENPAFEGTAAISTVFHDLRLWRALVKSQETFARAEQCFNPVLEESRRALLVEMKQLFEPAAQQANAIFRQLQTDDPRVIAKEMADDLRHAWQENLVHAATACTADFATLQAIVPDMEENVIMFVCAICAMQAVAESHGDIKALDAPGGMREAFAHYLPRYLKDADKEFGDDRSLFSMIKHPGAFSAIPQWRVILNDIALKLCGMGKSPSEVGVDIARIEKNLAQIEAQSLSLLPQAHIVYVAALTHGLLALPVFVPVEMEPWEEDYKEL